MILVPNLRKTNAFKGNSINVPVHRSVMSTICANLTTIICVRFLSTGEKDAGGQENTFNKYFE